MPLSAITDICVAFLCLILLEFWLLCFIINYSHHKMVMPTSQFLVLAWFLTLKMKIEIVLYISPPMFGIISVSTDKVVEVVTTAPEGSVF